MLDKIQFKTEKALQTLSARAPKSPFGRILLLWLDVLLINVTFFYFLKSLLFVPLGYSSAIGTFFLGLLFLVSLFIMYALETWIHHITLKYFLLQAGTFFLFALMVALLAAISVTEKGKDFSWIRVEMIKIPLWLKMFIPISPYYTLFIVTVISYLMWKSIVKPKAKEIRLVTGAGTLVMIYLIVDVFSKYGGLDFSAGDRPYNYEKSVYVYLVLFGAPMILFTALNWLRWFGLAFRSAPLMFHMSLIGLNYMGVLPVHSPFDLLPLTQESKDYVWNNHGVEKFFPPPGADPDSSFTFLRDIVVTPEKVFVNYGPTCGFLSIDRETKGASCLPVFGLTRDFQLSPDGQYLWAVNWETADFLAIDRESLEIECSMDLFGFHIATPYNFSIDGDRVIISNVTYPILAEVFIKTTEKSCVMQPGRKVDFMEEGYTKFTDGAFGLYHDIERGKIYVIVGMLEGEYLIGLVEVDDQTFEIERDIRLPLGTMIQPVPHRGTVLLPSYYGSEIYEVSLETMQLMRVMESEPNIVSMEYDQRRGLFYGLARGSGYLVVIDDSTGKTIKKIPVGAKPEPLWFSPEEDLLFIGSNAGILQIDLDLFLSELLIDKPKR
jgi:hypothetical protein